MFADRFAETFKAPIVSKTRLQREFDLSNEEAESLKEFILGEYLKTHKTVVIDGGYEVKAIRDELVRKLVKDGYRPLVVWVQTDTNEAFRRATKPYPKGSGLRDSEFDADLELFEAPSDKEKMVVISGKHTYTSQLKIVLKQLATPDHSQPKVPLSPQQAEAIQKVNVQNRSRNRGTFLR